MEIIIRKQNKIKTDVETQIYNFKKTYLIKKSFNLEEDDKGYLGLRYKLFIPKCVIDICFDCTDFNFLREKLIEKKIIKQNDEIASKQLNIINVLLAEYNILQGIKLMEK
jgi:hypothetical protein